MMIVMSVIGLLVATGNTTTTNLRHLLHTTIGTGTGTGTVGPITIYGSSGGSDVVDVGHGGAEEMSNNTLHAFRTWLTLKR